MFPPCWQLASDLMIENFWSSVIVAISKTSKLTRFFSWHFSSIEFVWLHLFKPLEGENRLCHLCTFEYLRSLIGIYRWFVNCDHADYNL